MVSAYLFLTVGDLSFECTVCKFACRKSSSVFCTMKLIAHVYQSSLCAYDAKIVVDVELP